MLSEAKHLCFLSRRNRNENNQRFFASLRITTLTARTTGRCYHSARLASISMLIATVWLIPDTASAPEANIKLKSRREIGSVVTAHRVRFVSLMGVTSFTWSVIGLVTPCIVRSPRMSPLCGPGRLTLRLLNVIWGNFSTLKNSGLRRWSSRFLICVSMLRTSI